MLRRVLYAVLCLVFLAAALGLGAWFTLEPPALEVPEAEALVFPNVTLVTPGGARRVGETLFVRDGRRVLLTEAGRILLEHAQAAFAQLEIGQQRLDALAGLNGGRLVIGTSDTLAYYMLPGALAAFRASHPGVELTLETRPSPATASAVAARTVDLGVVTLPLPEGLEHRGRPLEA